MVQRQIKREPRQRQGDARSCRGSLFSSPIRRCRSACPIGVSAQPRLTQHHGAQMWAWMRP